LIERRGGVPVLYGSSPSTTRASRVTDEMRDAAGSEFAVVEPNSGSVTASVFPLCFQTAIFRVYELLA
jgi:hypothetical protein